MLTNSRSPRFPRTADLGAAALLGLSCVLTGCMVGPKYHAPAPVPATAPATYKEAPAAASTPRAAQNTPQAADQHSAEYGDWKVAQPGDAMLRGKWWEVFGDPELNALEDKLNIDNQTIKQYFENFMAARE